MLSNTAVTILVQKCCRQFLIMGLGRTQTCLCLGEEAAEKRVSSAENLWKVETEDTTASHRLRGVS